MIVPTAAVVAVALAVILALSLVILGPSLLFVLTRRMVWPLLLVLLPLRWRPSVPRLYSYSRLVMIVLQLNSALPFQFSRVSAAGVSALVGRERRSMWHFVAVPVIPTTAVLLPV